MKGLLIKDFKLLKVQKNSFLLILCIAIGMEIFTNSTSSSFIIFFHHRLFIIRRHIVYAQLD